MRDQRKTEIKVGMTVIVALIIIIWIFTWAKNYSLHANQNTFNVEFESVSGLEKGDPITVNGVRKGFVDEISINNDKAIVKAVIDPDIKLKKDAKFSILMLDLMGGKKIEIKPGVSEELLDPNKLQQGTFYADIPQVMAMVGSVEDDLVRIIKDVQVTLSSLNNFLTDKEFNSQIKSSLANLNEMTAKLNLMINENHKNINTLVKNTTQLTGEASSFLHENKDQISNTLAEVNTLVKKTNDLMEKVNDFSNETKNQKNNIGKLLYDEKLIDDLQTTLKQAKELTTTLNEQLKGEGINVDANIDVF